MGARVGAPQHADDRRPPPWVLPGRAQELDGVPPGLVPRERLGVPPVEEPVQGGPAGLRQAVQDLGARDRAVLVPRDHVPGDADPVRERGAGEIQPEADLGDPPTEPGAAGRVEMGPPRRATSVRCSVSHAAPCTACHGVRSQAEPTAAVTESRRPSPRDGGALQSGHGGRGARGAAERG
jgi:hypothetical protein